MKRLLAFLAVAAVLIAPKGAGAASLIFNGSGVKQVLPGTNVTITGNPAYPVINASGGGGGVGGGSINTTTTETTAPSTPSAGNISTWVSSTDHRLHDKNSSGTVGTTVVPSTAGANQFCSAVSNAGVMSYAQPAFSNLSGSLTCAQEPAMSGGDIGSSAGTCALTINANAVTNAKAAQMAANTIKGNNTGSTANAADLTAAQATAMLNQFTSSLQGLAPASGGGTTNFLRADGTWNAPSGSSSINATTSETAAPASPSAGNVSTWVDSTDHRLHDKNSSGVIATTVVASTASSHQYATAVSAAGVMTYAQPVIGDITAFISSALAAQISDETGTGLACFATNPTLTGATMAGRLNLGDNPIDCGSSFHSDGNKTGASPTLADFSTTCNMHTWTLTGNVTGTPTWTIGGAKHFEVWVCQPGTGGPFTMVWPSSPTLIWAGSGSAPTLSTTASACDVIDFSYNGTTIVGQAVASGSGGGITAGTGDATFSGSGSVTVTNVNAPDGFTQAGKIIETQIAAPATPAAGKVSIWADSTDARFHDKNPAGSIGTTVVATTAGANQFCTGVNTNGGITFAQPSFSNLSGSGTCAQEPAMTGDATSSAGSCALTIAANAVTNSKMATMAASTVKMNNTGSSATPTDVGVATAYDAMCVRGADIASAATTSIGGQVGYDVNVTGTTTITSFGNCVAGLHRLVHFKGALTLTYNSTSLITLTAKNRTTANGDVALYTCDTTNNWREDFYSFAEDDVDEIDNGNLGGANVAVADWTKGTAQKITVNTTFTGTSTMTAPRKARARVQLTSCQNGTGGVAFLFPTANVRWANNTIPTWTTTANKCDVTTCTWNGTDYKCVASLNF